MDRRVGRRRRSAFIAETLRRALDDERARGLRAGEERSASRLLNGLRLAPLGRREGETAGRWRKLFASRGKTLSQADCLVAAAAAGIGGRLATGNPKDFPMKGLAVE